MTDVAGHSADPILKLAGKDDALNHTKGEPTSLNVNGQSHLTNSSSKPLDGTKALLGLDENIKEVSCANESKHASTSKQVHADGKNEHSSKNKHDHQGSTADKKKEHSSSSEKRKGGQSIDSTDKKKELSNGREKRKNGGDATGHQSNKNRASDGKAYTNVEKKKEHSSSEKRKEHDSSGKDVSSGKAKHHGSDVGSGTHPPTSKSSEKQGSGAVSDKNSSEKRTSQAQSSHGANDVAAKAKGHSTADKTERHGHKTARHGGEHSSSSKHKKEKHNGKEEKKGSAAIDTGKQHGLPVSTLPASKTSNDVTVKLEAPSATSPVKTGGGLVSETVSETSVKVSADSDDDVPLSKRKESTKAETTASTSTKVKMVKKRSHSEDEDDEDDVALISRVNKVKKVKTEETSTKKKVKTENIETKKRVAVKRKPASDDEGDSAGRKKKPKAAGETIVLKEKTKRELKKEVELKEVWRWWEEERKEGGVKWKFLEHKGPVFAADYVPLPDNIKFKYDGKVIHLRPETEEVAGFYARMIEHEYTTRDIFNKNFLKDWRQVMSSQEREQITDIKKCDFRAINEYYKKVSEEKKAQSKEEKLKIKDQNEKLIEEYGYCRVDGHNEKIGNFRIEPPGLFRGRGDHPKQGMLKRRLSPEDVIINCSKDSKVPTPPAGHKWKEVRHDDTVTWLCSWTENIQGQVKYVMLNASSRLKGEKDWMKYETARRLHKCIDKIRVNYEEDLRSKEMRIRQRAVALYFIDKLALRAGNEKDSDEQADTVGCCSLRVEHVRLHDELDGQECVVEFDFPGKDSIRYLNKVPVEKRVYKNAKLFVDNKQPGDLLFDRLNTTILNKHLQDLMDGLTAKVFRTYNASRTLEEQLDLMTDPNDTVAAKMLSYNRANRAVALLCNHQRAAPKNFEQQMCKMQDKIKEKQEQIKQAKKELKDAKSKTKDSKSESLQSICVKKKKTLERLEEQLAKMEVQATDKDENKEIALGTSKLNYLDPRISVAWCKKFDVPIDKVYNKTQKLKFMWALDMADADFCFLRL